MATNQEKLREEFIGQTRPYLDLCCEEGFYENRITAIEQDLAEAKAKRDRATENRVKIEERIRQIAIELHTPGAPSV